MPSETEETQLTHAVHTLTEFVTILVKEYPLVFKNSSCFIKVNPSAQPSFPYEVSLEIIKKEVSSTLSPPEINETDSASQKIEG